MRFLRLSCLLVLQSSVIAAPPDLQHDWPWWRGPNSNGIAAEGQTPPTEWSASKNVLWKVDIPGRGHSSPTIVGDQIFLTTADEQRQIQGAICFDKTTGKQLWITPIHTGGFPGEIHAKNTHASGTVACDGEQIYTTFYNEGAIKLSALSLAGKLMWTKNAGPFNPKKYQFGYAASPLLYKDLVIVSNEHDGACGLTAFKKNGAPAWKTPRHSDISFSSPIVGNINGKDQLLMSGLFEVSSYDPVTGKPLWSVSGTTQATCGTLVWDGDIVFASGGFPDPQTLAVKADGSKQVLWTNNQKCYEQSMLAYDGYLYALNDAGIAFCWRGTDGQEMWKQRLGGNVSSSPILVGQNIFAMNEEGTTFVFKATPDSYQQVARNQLGEEGFPSPTFVDNKIYIRTASLQGGRKETLYCIGE